MGLERKHMGRVFTSHMDNPPTFLLCALTCWAANRQFLSFQLSNLRVKDTQTHWFLQHRVLRDREQDMQRSWMELTFMLQG